MTEKVVLSTIDSLRANQTPPNTDLMPTLNRYANGH